MVYSRIYLYLKRHRMLREGRQADRARARRTNAMLVAISVLYCLCWLPLNLFNLVVDACDVAGCDPFEGGDARGDACHGGFETCLG